jgi:hypothetical protein
VSAVSEGDRSVHGIGEGDAEAVAAFARPRTFAMFPLALKFKPAKAVSLEREVRDEFDFRRLRKTRLFQKPAEVVLRGADSQSGLIELRRSIVSRLEVASGDEWCE